VGEDPPRLMTLRYLLPPDVLLSDYCVISGLHFFTKSTLVCLVLMLISFSVQSISSVCRWRAGIQTHSDVRRQRSTWSSRSGCRWS